MSVIVEQQNDIFDNLEKTTADVEVNTRAGYLPLSLLSSLTLCTEQISPQKPVIQQHPQDVNDGSVLEYSFS